jgi:hypothetical protein
MKGTEVDNRRRLAQLSPRVARERELAAWVGKSNIELTPTGELRVKPERQLATTTRESPHQLPDAGWE